MGKKSLWAEVEDIPTIKIPAFILKEQAELLGETTNSILRGDVKSFRASLRFFDDMPSETIVVDKTGSLLGFSLIIIAPQMNYYEYCVLTIAYDPVEVYPVYFESVVLSGIHQCRDESEFNDYLKKILSSERIKRVIMSLIAQSQEMAS
jgi:hypothetical protein